MTYEKKIGFMMCNTSYYGIDFNLAHHIEHGLGSCGFKQDEGIIYTPNQKKVYPLGLSRSHYQNHPLYKKYLTEYLSMFIFEEKNYDGTLDTLDFYKLQDVMQKLESEMDIKYSVELSSDEINVLLVALGGYSAISESDRTIRMFRMPAPPHINRDFEYRLIDILKKAKVNNGTN